MGMEMKMRVTTSKGPQNKWQLTGDFPPTQALCPILVGRKSQPKAKAIDKTI